MTKKGIVRSVLNHEKTIWHDEKLDENFDKTKKKFLAAAENAGLNPEVTEDEEDKMVFITDANEKVTITKEEIKGDTENG